VAAALADAHALGVLARSGGREVFRHPVVRAALADDLPAAVRAAWHRMAARALHQAGSTRGGRPPAAATLGTADHQLDPWAVDWLVEAAPVVLNQALAAAAGLLAAARREVDRDDPRRIALTTRLAAALHSVGRVGDVIELIEQTLSQVDDAELFTALHVTLAKCRTIIGQYELSRAELTEASTNPALGDRHRSRLRSTLAQQYVNLNRIDAAEPAAQEALAEVAAVDDPEAKGLPTAA
jgi:hypothetical protein